MKLFPVFALFSLALIVLPMSSPRRIEKLGNDHVAERGGLFLYDSRPFTGVVVERFPDGQVYQQARYENGLRDGVAEEFSTSGKLRARWNYKAGKKDGLQQGWYIEGPKRFEQNFRNGILEGTQIEWHMNGAVFRQQQYADGVEVANKTLYSTSEVYSNYVKKDGRVYGIDGGALCFESKKEGER